MAKTKKQARTPDDIHAWISEQPSAQRSGLRSTLKDLRAMYKTNELKMLWWYDIGVLVDEFFPDSGRQYGSGVNARLARELGATEENEVTNESNKLLYARKIARTLTRKEAESWTRKKNSRGRLLSAYHIVAVAAIEDKAQRDELLERCMDESWSASRLRAEVQNQFGKKRSRGGRKAKPRNVVPMPIVGLQEIRVQSRRWLADHKVWFGNKKASLRNVPKRAQTDDLQAELEKTTAALGEMQKALTEARKCLKQLTRDVKAKLKRKG